MKIFKITLTILFFIIGSIPSYSQDNLDNQITKSTINSGTIENQFDYLDKVSTSYKSPSKKEYKVIKKENLTKLKKNTLDSLKTLKISLNETKKIITNQEIEITNLKTNLKTTNDNLTDVSIEKDNIDFLGYPLTKSSYNSILWSIVAVLFVLLLFFIFRFKSSNSITKQANKLLAETESEFDAYKTKSLEREQKVRRELQDEINKQKYGANNDNKE